MAAEPYYGTLTDVPGVKVGHETDREHGTGTTVIVFEAGAAGGVDVRGMASGSRELSALDPLHVTPACHALCLSGGSAFGLAAADGVMQYLAERDIGYFARVAYVPIVPAAIIFDLSFIDHTVRPDRGFGYRACVNATSGPVVMGSVGAGTGATVGKLLGMERAMKSGVGSASARTRSGATVGALAVVNNLGDVLDRKTGAIIAGTRTESNTFADTAALLAQLALPSTPVGENTNLVAVATDARLDKIGAAKLARMASAGMARTLRPAHSTFDGDLVFAFSTGALTADVNVLGTLAADLVALAINRAVEEARGLGGVPALRDLPRP
jgi:L-aminopeptidase/D-esterase-like protein